MRIALVILLGIHGLIHLFGFLKAYGLAEFEALSQPISKPVGLVWLSVFLLFVLSIVLYLYSSDYWLISGIIAVVMSQILIVMYWSDAKFGTIANILILVPLVVGFANYRFKQRVAIERQMLLQHATDVPERPISKKDISSLPSCVQNWLERSGTLGKPMAQSVYLEQDLELKLKPEQNDWLKGTAEQYFTTNPPAFHWSISTSMNPFLPIVGRDKFENGNGAMLIKLLALIPVANAKDNANIDQATLQRYLAEIVWFPSAAISSYISWEEIDDNSARATMTYKGTTGSGLFHFDEEGDFVMFECLRYKDASDKNPSKWTVKAVKIEEQSGIRIPVECEASWDINGEDWKWLKLKIKNLVYDKPTGV